MPYYDTRNQHCAWDGSDLCAHDGHRPLQATDAHISIVGHVTQSELAHHLSRTESHNGFANRCLWISVRAAQQIPARGQPLVETCHLHAALAVWDYCLASARLFFDASPVDPTAQRIGEALDAAPEGLTRTQIRGLFHGHVSTERIDLALEQLSSLGLINRRTETGRGRSSTLWAGVEDTKADDAGA